MLIDVPMGVSPGIILVSYMLRSFQRRKKPNCSIDKMHSSGLIRMKQEKGDLKLVTYESQSPTSEQKANEQEEHFYSLALILSL